MLVMEVRIDLDEAAQLIEERREAWQRRGILVGDATWREAGEWPWVVKTSRSEVEDADSVGVALSKGDQEGSVVLFRGGWADFVYWSGDPSDEPVMESPGWQDWLTIESFGVLLDRLGGLS
jgi:hypothetical protein